ncbi:MAG: hypothetical protein ACK5RO_08210 [Pseudobdellovibrionaceae bacterium]
MWNMLIRRINLIFFFLAFSSGTVLANNYALVIGGSSKKVESKHHEFARVTAAATIGLEAKGYKVTTLFGSGREDQEKEKYSDDFKKLDPLQANNAVGTSRAATSSNIDSVFEALIEKTKSGDKIEILLIAHGSDTCQELGPHIRSDAGSQCQHTFTVFDSAGREIQYPSEKVLRYVKKLEDKGALPSIVLGSCHSGRAKAQFKNLGLTNTCAYFQTAGNELGYGCFDDDPDFATDFTSTGEYVAMRYYQASLPTLEKDPYFSQSACFQKTAKHYRDKKLNLSSISSAYWTSRTQDLTFQSPALSTLLTFPYFTTGLFQPQITKEQSLSCEQLSSTNNALIKQLTSLGAHLTDAATVPYYQALNDYNSAVRSLKDELDKKLPETPENLLRITTLQSKVKEKAKGFMLQERQLIDQIFRDHRDVSDPCSRSL